MLGAGLQIQFREGVRGERISLSGDRLWVQFDGGIGPQCLLNLGLQRFPLPFHLGHHLLAGQRLFIGLAPDIVWRTVDLFRIFDVVFVLTGGGPGNSTTVLSIDLVKIALGQFDLGPAAAMSLIYFLIILLLSWVFYRVMTPAEEGA